MPSSPNYKRDYKQERKTALARGEGPKIAERNKARRALQKEGRVAPFDGKDIDHIKPLSKGGSVGRENLRVKDASDNRSFKRNPDGSIKK